MIIAIEGADATGKATQSKLLAERLGVELFSFPNYETPAGQAILGNLKGHWRTMADANTDGPVNEIASNALVLQSLMLVNRMELAQPILKAAKLGRVVLDRYAASGMVYGTLDGLDPAWIEMTNARLPVQPDLYVLLDAPVEESFKRRPERRDRYESNRPYLEQVRAEYLRLFTEKAATRQHLFNKDPGATRRGLGPKWRVVDALGTVEEVAARVWEAVQKWEP